MLRLYNLLFIGGGGFVIPFVSVFYVRQGLSGTQIGIISTISALVGLLAAPLWGRISDSSAQPRRVLQIALLGGVAYYLALSRQTSFLPMALLAAGGALALAGCYPLTDALSLRMTGKAGYGSVRLWGSLGWAIIVLFAGWLTDRVGLRAMFYGYAVTVLAAALVLELVPVPAGTAAGGGRRAFGGWRGILHGLLLKRELAGLALALTVFWLTNGMMYQFSMVFLDDLGAGETLIGVSAMVASVIELPGMLWADRLVQRYRPSYLLIGWLLLAAVSRIIILSAPLVPVIIATRVLDGVGFSMFAVGFVYYVNRHALPGQTAMLMALFGVTLSNLVLMVASPLAGAIYDAVGAYWLYALGLVGCLGGVAILAVTIARRGVATPRR